MGADTGGGVGGIAASCAATFGPSIKAQALMAKVITVERYARMRLPVFCIAAYWHNEQGL